jgi:hypothetical protein
MADINVTVNDTRIYKLREYMFSVLDGMLTNKVYQVNANFLDKDINNYSLDRIPVKPMVENWIIPTKKFREVYEFRSRNIYGQDVMDNLKSVGFFEILEDKIYSNNKEGVLPNIEGIESIQCLNCGSLNIADTDKCEFSVQIQIDYTQNINANTTTSL